MSTHYQTTDRREQFSDRRKHKRYRLRPGVFAGFRPNMGEIIDISIGGLSFHHLEIAKGVEEKNDFVICSEDGCCLDSFPCQIVADRVLANESSFSQIVTRQRRIMFGQLSDSQQALLNDFIRHHIDSSH